MHFTVDEDDDGSSPFGPAIFLGRLAETDQRRPEEPKSLVRYHERPPIFQKGENLCLHSRVRWTLSLRRLEPSAFPNSLKHVAI